MFDVSNKMRSLLSWATKRTQTAHANHILYWHLRKNPCSQPDTFNKSSSYKKRAPNRNQFIFDRNGSFGGWCAIIIAL